MVPMTATPLVNLAAPIDDAKCFALIRQHRWPDVVRCPSCGSAAWRGMAATRQRWLGLSEQALRLDKWSVCRVQAAAICGSLVK
jgi:hypothetical protein